MLMGMFSDKYTSDGSAKRMEYELFVFKRLGWLLK
jgi:hypothetical protein